MEGFYGTVGEGAESKVTTIQVSRGNRLSQLAQTHFKKACWRAPCAMVAAPLGSRSETVWSEVGG